jgi:hypothetical protein
MKTKKKSKVKPKDKDKVGKIQNYYESLDLQTWWEQFTTKCNENGTLKYPTVWSFISAKTKDKKQRSFLWWLLGPKGESEEYKKYPQFDWEDRKEKGHWYNSTNVDKLKKEVKAHTNALDALREVGKVNIDFISRLVHLAQEIDREYLGRLFLPELSQKENTFRVKTYTNLLGDLQLMMDRAQIMFGRTQGMDLERLDTFLEMFGKGMSQAAAQMGFVNAKTIDAEVDPSRSAMQKVMEMVMAKKAAFDLDLPDPEMDEIISNTSNKPVLISRTN